MKLLTKALLVQSKYFTLLQMLHLIMTELMIGHTVRYDMDDLCYHLYSLIPAENLKHKHLKKSIIWCSKYGQP